MSLSEREDTPDPRSPRRRHLQPVPSTTERIVADLLAGLGPDKPLKAADLVPLGAEDTVAHAEFATFGLPTYAEDEPADWPASIVAELVRVPRALGDYLEHLPPGPRLARVLDAIDTDTVDDYSLVEVVAAYRRMESWSAARTARAAAALSERPALNPTWPGKVAGRNRGECVVGEELAMRLRMSRQTAMRIVDCGRAFGTLFQLTGEALEEGQIDYPRARAIVVALEELPTDVAMAAQWEVLEKAPGRTLRQLQNDIEKAVIAVDPDHADERHRIARSKRCVHRPRPLPDGMAQVSAILPAADAIAVDLALDATARAAKHHGDKRTLDQLRADTLALMGHTALACGHIGPDAELRVCSCGGVVEAGRPDVADTGRSSAPVGPPAGSPPGKFTCRTADDIPPHDDSSHHPPPRRVRAGSTGDDTTVEAPPHLGSTPGPGDDATVEPPPDPGSTRDPGDDTALEPPPVPNRAGSAGDDADTRAQSSPTGPSPVAACPPYPGHRVPGGALPTVRLGAIAGGRADIRVYVPLGVFLPEPGQQSPLERLTEPVAELEGYGPVPPVIARALAAGGVWRRLVTDPATDRVLDVGRTRYQPPPDIAELARERDHTCIRPGCPRAARHTELDHEHEWQHGGVTSVENTDPTCGRDHAIKTIGAYTVAHGTDRTYAWAGPTGHGYLRRPDGTIVTMPRRSSEELRALGRTSVRERRSIDPAFVDSVLAQISAGTDVGGGGWEPPGGRRTTMWPGAEDGPSWTGDDEPPF